MKEERRKSIEERRKYIRVKKQVDAAYQCIVKDKIAWITVSVKNLSASGICILIDRFPLIGEDFLLRLRTPLNPKEWFQVNAKVVDVEKFMDNVYLARLKFTDLQDEDKIRIREYVNFCLNREKRL